MKYNFFIEKTDKEQQSLQKRKDLAKRHSGLIEGYFPSYRLSFYYNVDVMYYNVEAKHFPHFHHVSEDKLYLATYLIVVPISLHFWSFEFGKL